MTVCCKPSTVAVVFVSLLCCGGTVIAGETLRFDLAKLRTVASSDNKVAFATGLMEKVRPWLSGVIAEGNRVTVDGRWILVESLKTKSTRRVRAPNPNNTDLTILGVSQGVVFFGHKRFAHRNDGERIRYDPKIQRYDIRSHAWLSPVLISDGVQSPTKESGDMVERSIVSVNVGKKGVLILAYRFIRTPNSFVEVTHYTTAMWRPRKNAASWSFTTKWTVKGKQWPVELDEHDVLVGHQDKVQLLTWVDATEENDLEEHGEFVLICAGNNKDIVCRRAKDGHEVWRIRRIWEYRRGAFGGSVDNGNYISRFGVDPYKFSNPDKNADELEKQKKATMNQAMLSFYRQNEAKIVAGPVVAKAIGKGAAATTSIFVSVAKRVRNNESGVYNDLTAAHGMMYEITLGGDIVAISPLPVVADGPSHIVQNHFFWYSNEGAAVQINLLARTGGRLMKWTRQGRCAIEWFRSFSEPPIEYALWKDPTRILSCSGKRWIFFTGRAYVSRDEKAMYKERIYAVDTHDGRIVNLSLCIPIETDANQKNGGDGIVIRDGSEQRRFEDTACRIVHLGLNKNNVLTVALRASKGKNVRLSFDVSRLSYHLRDSQ